MITHLFIDSAESALRLLVFELYCISLTREPGATFDQASRQHTTRAANSHGRTRASMIRPVSIPRRQSS